MQHATDVQQAEEDEFELGCPPLFEFASSMDAQQLEHAADEAIAKGHGTPSIRYNPCIIGLKGGGGWGKELQAPDVVTGWNPQTVICLLCQERPTMQGLRRCNESNAVP